MISIAVVVNFADAINFLPVNNICLDQVQKKKIISKEDFSQLKSRNLVEGRCPNIFVSYEVAKAVGDKASYVRQKGLEEEVCMQLILSTFKFEPAKKADLFVVLKDSLLDVLTEEQKSKKMSNLLQERMKIKQANF